MIDMYEVRSKWTDPDTGVTVVDTDAGLRILRGQDTVPPLLGSEILAVEAYRAREVEST